ncbi:MAG: VOC family protein [Lachnospiraceae bacterium]|nr:VOC family protein [Lachnospiraceae bacterium]MDN4742256.1 VOC family protein [Lachnospiraceae bacterium C1.1]
MSLTVDHIGYLVKRTAKAEDVFKCLGYKIKRELYHDESRKCDFSFLEKDGLVIELITPWNSESPIFPMLKHHKNMIYHICYKSDNMDEDIKTLEEKGFKLVEAPKPAPAISDRADVAFMMHMEIGMLEIVSEKDQ